MSIVKASFVFINDNPHADDVTTLSKRKIVRAQAARQQPQQNRLQGSQQVKSAAKWNKYQARKRNRHQTTLNTFQISLNSLDDLPKNNYATRKLSPPDRNEPVEYPTPKSKSSSEARSNSTPGSEARSNSTPGSEARANSTPSSAPTLDKPTADNKNEIEEDVDEIIRKDRQPTALTVRMPGAGWATPFLPVQALNKPYVPTLISHYLTNLAVDIPELDAGTAGILRSRWFPMVITAEATANVVLLTAASHYAIFHGLSGNPQIKRILLYLKCQTYAAVQKLIANSSPDRRDDVLIGSVAKLASYEAMFGTSELYHLHIRNLQIMIQERGGLDTLGLGGLLQRMVLWIDINSAFILNSTAYFLPRVPLAGHVILQQPNPSGFLGKY